jgi:GntR family transcriptional regulator, arabinose operon transcriptional repressor
MYTNVQLMNIYTNLKNMDIQPFSDSELLPAYVRVADDLRSKFGKSGYEFGKLLLSEHELSKAYNLSRGTIRKALNILADEQLISRQPGRGTIILPPQSKHAEKRKNIAVVVSIMRGVNEEMFSSIEQSLYQANCNLISSSTRQDPDLESELLERFLIDNPDGLILYTTGTARNVDLIRKLVEAKVPTILHDRFIDSLGDNLNWVVAENFEGAYEITKHLIDLQHKKIAFVAWTPDYEFINTIQERRAGYEQAMTDHDLDLTTLIDCGTQITPSSKRSFAEKMYGFIEKYKPTAIFFHNDAAIYHLYQQFFDWGIQIPQDISVVGFDKLEIAFGSVPFDLTTVRQDFKRFGQITTDTLLSQIKNPTQQPVQIRVPVSLHIGNTTAIPKQSSDSL